MLPFAEIQMVKINIEFYYKNNRIDNWSFTQFQSISENYWGWI